MAMRYSARDLNKRVELLKPVESRDKIGGVSRKWELIACTCAKVQPLTSRELLAADKTQSEITHRVIIRYRSDITAKWRIRYRNRILEVADAPINVDEQDRYLQMNCTEATE